MPSVRRAPRKIGRAESGVEGEIENRDASISLEDVQVLRQIAPLRDVSFESATAPAVPPVDTQNTSTDAKHSARFAALFHDVDALKQNAIESHRHGEAIERIRETLSVFRGDLDDMKSQVNELARRCEHGQDMNASCEPQAAVEAAQASPARTLVLETCAYQGNSERSDLTGAMTIPRKIPVHATHEIGRGVAIHRQDQLAQAGCLEHSVDFHFHESLFDVACFIGTQILTVGESIFVVVLLLLSTTIQCLYALLVYTEFAESDLNDEAVAGYVDFRVRVAHDFKYFDHSTKASLAAKICAEDKTVEVAGRQVDVLKAVREYIPEGTGKMFGESTGPLMCFLACTVWYLIVEKEFRLVLHSIAAMLKNCDEYGMASTRLIFDGRMWAISGLSVKRVLIMMLLQILRLAIAASLLVSGLLYLIDTLSLPDLVLNAVALECVLQVDELCFAAFAPFRLVAFIKSLKGLPLPRCSVCHGSDLLALAGFLSGAAIIGGFVPAVLFSRVKVLREVRDALCGGDVDFTYARTNYAPFFAWSPTTPHDKTGKNEFEDRVVRSIIDHTHGYHQYWMLPWPSGSRRSLAAVHRWTIEHATLKKNPACKDHPAQVIMAFSQSLISKGAKGVAVCANMSSYCDEDCPRGVAARGICPQTCGCDVPNSYLVLASYEAGCPATCALQKPYRDVLDKTNCTDWSRSDLVASGRWNYRAIQPIRIAKNWASQKDIFLSTKINDTMFNHGCGAIAIIWEQFQLDLCADPEHYWYFKSLRLFCPETCNCTASKKDCPTRCPNK